MNEKQSEKQGPITMDEPLKKHGDKIDRGRLGGIEKEHASDQKGGAGDVLPQSCQRWAKVPRIQPRS